MRAIHRALAAVTATGIVVAGPAAPARAAGPIVEVSAVALPMPRGVPQIEVQFELDGDGVLVVTAVDRDGNTGSSGLVNSATVCDAGGLRRCAVPVSAVSPLAAFGVGDVVTVAILATHTSGSGLPAVDTASAVVIVA